MTKNCSLDIPKFRPYNPVLENGVNSFNIKRWHENWAWILFRNLGI